MLKAMQAGIFAVCSGLAWCASADQVQTPAAAGDTPSRQRDFAVPAPVKVEKPMNMDEPMRGGMMKQGMMKYDVKKSAEKKDERMKEMLEKEAASMPPMPAQSP